MGRSQLKSRAGPADQSHSFSAKLGSNDWTESSPSLAFYTISSHGFFTLKRGFWPQSLKRPCLLNFWSALYWIPYLNSARYKFLIFRCLFCIFSGPELLYRRLQNPQIASVIVSSKWDRMVYNTVLTAEKRGPQIVGAQIAGVYCSRDFRKSDQHSKFGSARDTRGHS